MHQSLFAYERYRYLKLASFLSILSLIAYILHQPTEPANGGTWLGYTLGGLGAFIILLLLWLGIRKRSFQSGMGTVEGWVSAHVYLGTALIFISTLHTGFQFGLNVHTLAYTLMMFVILSGFYGIYTYVRMPKLVTLNREQRSKEQMIDVIAEMDQTCLELSVEAGDDIHEFILKSIDETRLGGKPAEQLSSASDTASEKVLADITQRLSKEHDPQQAQRLRALLEALREKYATVERIQRDIRYRGLMQIWLYIHVPISIGLLAALIAHVLSVFFYW